MLRVLFFAAIVYTVFHTRPGAPLMHYLDSAAEAITRSFAP